MVLSVKVRGGVSGVARCQGGFERLMPGVMRRVRRREKIVKLIIFDDGTIKKTEDISDSEIEAANERVIEIIDIVDPERPVYYNANTGEWEPIESA